MRTSTFALALPALASAQNFPQFPIIDQVTNQVKSFLGQATASASSVAGQIPTSVPIPDPVGYGAAKVAAVNVERLTLENREELLKPGAATASPGIETWMVFVTGANLTCFGSCERAERAWNESTALLSASPTAPRLAMLNCDQEPVLCNAWAMSPPTVIHIQLPQPLADQSTPATTVRSISLNRTTVTAPEIAALHLQDKYLEKEVYEGFWHPFDGPLAKSGMQIPLAYAIWGFSKVPSWAFMIGLSFVSRTFMQRRMTPAQGGARAAPPPGAAAPAN
ncbi:hypothetical protein LTR78_004939 [Recurvomyces mirabilis]|uniref:Protein BIG1 n=1 Tax=Recurvomyces mirabilis TaxID=574656 RepID=A0AAE0WNF6_9PEZI|nr:hypothetical protein LTR78_004939 [Recurvomyces mirabilis]KAK5158444.1 hypothetical protein LTS14_003463 [Recurvomyces mirabilis]